MAVERRVVFVEQDRLLGDGIAGLGRMLAVVEPDADDLFRVRDARAESGLVGGDEVALGGRACTRFVGEALEAADVALSLEHRVDAGRGALAEILFGGNDVEGYRARCAARARNRRPAAAWQKSSPWAAELVRPFSRHLGRRPWSPGSHPS